MTGIEKEINSSSLTSTHPTIPNQRIRWATLESINIKIIIKTVSCNFIPKTKFFFNPYGQNWGIASILYFDFLVYRIHFLFLNKEWPYNTFYNTFFFTLNTFSFAWFFSFWLLLFFLLYFIYFKLEFLTH